MSDGGFDALFDRFTATAFRLEAQPTYRVGEEDARMRAWRERTPRPERSVRTDPWLARIAVSTVAGKHWQRVRVVDWPLPEYLRYELTGYGENQAVGEETLLVDRDVAARAGILPPHRSTDVWLFDGGTQQARAAVLHYTADGAFEGFELIEDAEQANRFETVRGRLVKIALPLNTWLTQHAAEQRVA